MNFEIYINNLLRIFTQWLCQWLLFSAMFNAILIKCSYIQSHKALDPWQTQPTLYERMATALMQRVVRTPALLARLVFWVAFSLTNITITVLRIWRSGVLTKRGTDLTVPSRVPPGSDLVYTLCIYAAARVSLNSQNSRTESQVLRSEDAAHEIHQGWENFSNLGHPGELQKFWFPWEKKHPKFYVW